MPRETDPPEPRPNEDDDRADARPQDDHLRDAAGRDLEGGRNSGHTSDETRQST